MLSHICLSHKKQRNQCLGLLQVFLWILEWKGDLFSVFYRPDAQIMPMNHYNDHVWTNSISTVLPCEVAPWFSLLAKDGGVIHTSWNLHRKVQEEKVQKNISSPDVFVNNIFFILLNYYTRNLNHIDSILAQMFGWGWTFLSLLAVMPTIYFPA